MSYINDTLTNGKTMKTFRS